MKLPRRRFLGIALSAIALPSALWISGCAKKPRRGQPVARGATVLALGDSITYGTGATPETGYPSVLAQLTGWTVVNAGVPGDTSEQALQRLPALLQEHTPALVLVSIGGNDFLRRLPTAATRATIRRICETTLAARAQVLLIAVPAVNLAAAVVRSLDDHPLYAELADELKLPLQRGGWSEVLADASLRADAVHANAQGYARFAQRLAATAREAGLLDERR